MKCQLRRINSCSRACSIQGQLLIHFVDSKRDSKMKFQNLLLCMQLMNFVLTKVMHEKVVEVKTNSK
jgi:hypothetical protein